VTTPPWLIELPTCESTNSWALAHAEALAHGACVWTTRQTAGRGRGSKRWYAPPGVLTASFVLVQSSALASRQLSLAAGLAVAHAVEDLTPRARISIKWPNDCYYDNRKLAGILCERSSSDERVIIGIGLNLDPQWDQSPDQLPFALDSAASVAEACLPEDKRRVPTMPAMLQSLRRYLIEASGMISADGWDKLLTPLRTRDWLRGKQVTVEDGAKQCSGQAAGFDADGNLLLQEGTTVHRMQAGTVTATDTAPAAARSSRWFANPRRKSRGTPGS
jgi:BirA family biotin operon repressor/biotin-[acetyl-CoA-carboxylase] ligase